MKKRVKLDIPVTIAFIHDDSIETQRFDSCLSTDKNISIDYYGRTYRLNKNEDYYVNGLMQYAVILNHDKMAEAIEELKKQRIKSLYNQRAVIKESLRKNLIAISKAERI